MKALQFYLGSPSIPALDLLYKSSLTEQQRAHENRQDNNNMVAWAQQQQGLNRAELFKAELQKMIYKQRNAFNRDDNIIPLHIHCPGIPYPNDRDTEYNGPSIPHTTEQRLAQEITRIIRKTVRIIASE